jgi:hypothetical protein
MHACAATGVQPRPDLRFRKAARSLETVSTASAEHPFIIRECRSCRAPSMLTSLTCGHANLYVLTTSRSSARRTLHKGIPTLRCNEVSQMPTLEDARWASSSWSGRSSILSCSSRREVQ